MNENFNNQNNMSGMPNPTQNFNNQNGMNSNPTQNYNFSNNGRQGNNNILFIIIGVIVVVVIGVLAYFAFGNKSGSASSNNTTNNSGTTIDSTPVASNSFYKVNYGGFTFSVPDNMQYFEGDGYLIISNRENTWEAGLQVLEGSFDVIKSKINQIGSIMSNQGYTVNNVQNKTYNGVNFITMEAVIEGTNQLFVYAKLNSMYFAGLNIINIDNEYDYDLLNDIASVVKNATYNSESNNIKVGLIKDKIKLDSIETITK